MAETALLRSIVFADVVGSTGIYRRLGDEKAEKLIRGALDRVTATAQRLGGRLVKTIGDCALLEFPDADGAARTALEVQRDTRIPVGDEPVLFRIGFVHGQVVPRDSDIFGDAVNVAARLCDMAKADQVLTTEATGELLGPDLREAMRLFDHTPVKGIAEALKIVQLLWDRRATTQVFVFPKETQPDSFGELQLTVDGRTIALDATRMPFTLGREEGCDLVIPSPCASREHARVEFHRGKVTLVDESTNGTYVLPEGVAADKVVYIRREPFTLLGKGMFALGEKPVAGGPFVVSYDVR